MRRNVISFQFAYVILSGNCLPSIHEILIGRFPIHRQNDVHYFPRHARSRMPRNFD
jgi:hypothetical protein